MKEIIVILFTIMSLNSNAQLLDKSFHYMIGSYPTAICNVENHLVLRFINNDTVLIENVSRHNCSPKLYNQLNINSYKKYSYKFIDTKIIHIDSFVEFGNFQIQEKRIVGLKEGISGKERDFGQINFEEFEYNSWIPLPNNNYIKSGKTKKEKLKTSQEVPPNGTFIFTVKDFEASKTGKWKVIIKGNKATIYSLGQEIWDTTAKKGDLVAKTNIIKYKGKWISVNDNELEKDFEVINGGQFETWDFKNKVIGTF